MKLGLKDNLGFVGLIREGGMVLWIGCFFWLSGVSMGLFVVVLGSLLSGSLGFPLLWALKVVALGRG